MGEGGPTGVTPTHPLGGRGGAEPGISTDQELASTTTNCKAHEDKVFLSTSRTYVFLKLILL